jgi:hypothetical protein
LERFVKLIPSNDNTVLAEGGILLRKLLCDTLHDLSLGKPIESFQKEETLKAMDAILANHKSYYQAFRPSVFPILGEMRDTWGMSSPEPP